MKILGTATALSTTATKFGSATAVYVFNTHTADQTVEVRTVTKSGSGTGTVVVTAANTTAVGTGTDFTGFAVNDLLHVGKNNYKFTAIANGTVATIASDVAGETLVGASSNGDYVVTDPEGKRFSTKTVYVAKSSGLTLSLERKDGIRGAATLYATEVADSGI